jgi:NADPH:quinone reductase-like Zn-dependent oxidoreductase
VEAVGRNVTEFKPGDAVFGEIGGGAFAEYACVHEKYLALKPANVSFAEAASVPVVGFTALQGLRDAGQIQAGQKVLDQRRVRRHSGRSPYNWPKRMGRK